MKTLSTHQSNFTWARNQYNKTDDPDDQTKYIQYMAKYLAQGLSDNFTQEQITHGNDYPAEVNKHISDATSNALPSISEEQARKEIEEAVDIDGVGRIGDGVAAVYAYGYRCCPDRLKIGYTAGDVVRRIADQIFTSTPDKPVLHLEIRTNGSRALERAIHSVLELRGLRIKGGGDEWFKVNCEEILSIYQFITQR